MIGIICAMQIEADGIINLTQNKTTKTINKMNFTSGTINGKDVVIVVCSEGKVNAAMCATTLILNYNPDIVINSGVAGALSSKVSIGDIVIATSAVEHDMNMTALGYRRGEVIVPDGKMIYFECDKKIANTFYEVCNKIENTRVEKGVIASGDIFVSDRSHRLKIADAFDALACEMEGAAIGHVCYRCGVPYGIIRAISDDLNENKGMDFVKFCKLAAEKTVFAVVNFVESFSITK